MKGSMLVSDKKAFLLVAKMSDDGTLQDYSNCWKPSYKIYENLSLTVNSNLFIFFKNPDTNSEAWKWADKGMMISSYKFPFYRWWIGKDTIENPSKGFQEIAPQISQIQQVVKSSIHILANNFHVVLGVN